MMIPKLFRRIFPSSVNVHMFDLKDATQWLFQRSAGWRRYVLPITGWLVSLPLLIMGVNISSWSDVLSFVMTFGVAGFVMYKLYRELQGVLHPLLDARKLHQHIHAQLLKGVNTPEWKTYMQAWGAMFWVPIHRQYEMWMKWSKEAIEMDETLVPVVDQSTLDQQSKRARRVWEWVSYTDRVFPSTPRFEHRFHDRMQRAFDLIQRYVEQREKRGLIQDGVILSTLLAVVVAFPWVAVFKILTLMVVTGGWMFWKHTQALVRDTLALKAHEKEMLQQLFEAPLTGVPWLDETKQQARTWYEKHPLDPRWGEWLKRWKQVELHGFEVPSLESQSLELQHLETPQPSVWFRETHTSGHYGPWVNAKPAPQPPRAEEPVSTVMVVEDEIDPTLFDLPDDTPLTIDSSLSRSA